MFKKIDEISVENSLFLARRTLKVRSASVKHRTRQFQPEHRLWWIHRRRNLVVPGDSIGNYAVQRVENVLRVDKSVNVKFAEIFCHRDSPLCQLRRVNLQPRTDILKNSVNHSRHGFFLVRTQRTHNVSQRANQMPPEDVSFCEASNNVLGDFWIVPVQPAQIFHDFLDVSFVKFLENQEADVLLYRCALLSLDF